jgi:hypothetical protein
MMVSGLRSRAGRQRDRDQTKREKNSFQLLKPWNRRLTAGLGYQSLVLWVRGVKKCGGYGEAGRAQRKKRGKEEKKPRRDEDEYLREDGGGRHAKVTTSYWMNEFFFLTVEHART